MEFGEQCNSVRRRALNYWVTPTKAVLKFHASCETCVRQLACIPELSSKPRQRRVDVNMCLGSTAMLILHDHAKRPGLFTLS